MIDKILFEKHLGFQCPKSITCKLSQRNQLQSMQEAIEDTRSECVDGLFSFSNLSLDAIFFFLLIELSFPDVNAAKEIKTDAETIYFNRNAFSKIFHAITEHITTQTHWILGESFTEILDPIDNDEHKRIITIDNIFTVCIFFREKRERERASLNHWQFFVFFFSFLQALGVNNMENVHLLKEYFLPYASCIQCSIKYTDYQINSITECLQHTNQHIFANFAVEQYMIPIIMQQFLIDLSTKADTSIVNKLNKAIDNNVDESVVTVSRPIDLSEIEQFWNHYVNALPSDLEIIWDTIENGLIRYLEVR